MELISKNSKLRGDMVPSEIIHNIAVLCMRVGQPPKVAGAMMVAAGITRAEIQAYIKKERVTQIQKHTG